MTEQLSSLRISATNPDEQDVEGLTLSSLAAGDQITIAATHQVRIDGLDAWIKIEVTSKVQDTETSDQAFDRVGGSIRTRIVREIEQQAGVIVEANRRQ